MPIKGFYFISFHGKGDKLAPKLPGGQEGSVKKQINGFELKKQYPSNEFDGTCGTPVE